MSQLDHNEQPAPGPVDRRVDRRVGQHTRRRRELLEQINACRREVRSWPDWMRQTFVAPKRITSHTTDL